MWSNTKLLVLFSLSIVFLGLGLLWFGVKPAERISSTPQPIPQSATQGIEGEKVLVLNVVDGDTFELEDGQKVRLIGIDTPETKDPRRPVGCFGKEASEESKKLIGGKMVILQKDISETDKYNRLLRLVFLPLETNQVLFVNDYLVREGFAKASTYPPDVKFSEQFRQAETQAREGKKGLWGRCF